MAETVSGGVYKDATGNGYHDANGNKVSADVVAESQRLQSEQSRQKLAQFTPVAEKQSGNDALVNALRSLAAPQPSVTNVVNDASGDSKPSETKK